MEYVSIVAQKNLPVLFQNLPVLFQKVPVIFRKHPRAFLGKQSKGNDCHEHLCL